MRSQKFLMILLLVFVYVFVYQDFFKFYNTRLANYGDLMAATRHIDYLSEQITQLNFKEALNLPHYYPYQYSLFYSTSEIPFALIMVPFQLFINNQFTIINIGILITGVFNIISAYLLTKRFSSIPIVNFIGTVSLSFPSFYVLHLGHLQFHTLWAFYLFMALLLDLFVLNKSYILTKKFVKSLTLSLMMIIQLYTSPYIFVMMLLIFFVANIIFYSKLLKNLKLSLVIFLVFLIGASPFLYFNSKISENLNEHEDNEYIVHSAEVSDYFYIYPNTLLTSANLFDLNTHWKSYKSIGERGYYPRYLITIFLFVIRDVYIFLQKKSFKLIIQKKIKLLLFSLIIVSMVFSFGPYFQINNLITEIKLPAYIFTQVPFLSGMRSLSRWEFIAEVCIILLMIVYISEHSTRIFEISEKPLNFINKYLFILIILFYVTPLPIKLYEPNFLWSFSAYLYLPDPCDNTLLEIPNQSSYQRGEYANYHKLIFWSTQYHSCNLINGSSSFVPKSYVAMWDEINREMYFSKKILSKYNINYIKVNIIELSWYENNNLESFKQKFPYCSEIFSDNNNLLFNCMPNNKNYLNSKIVDTFLSNYSVSNSRNYMHSLNFFPIEGGLYQWSQERSSILMQNQLKKKNINIKGFFDKSLANSKHFQLYINDVEQYESELMAGNFNLCIPISDDLDFDSPLRVDLISETHRGSETDGRKLGIAIKEISFTDYCSTEIE